MCYPLQDGLGNTHLDRGFDLSVFFLLGLKKGERKTLNQLHILEQCKVFI